jgi:hypothetical protein
MGLFDALAVACNILYLVKTASEFGKTCQKIVKRRSTAGNERLKQSAADLSTANKDLRNALGMKIPSTYFILG